MFCKGQHTLLTLTGCWRLIEAWQHFPRCPWLPKNASLDSGIQSEIG